MDDPKWSAGWLETIAFTAAVLLVPLGLYIGGYFATSETGVSILVDIDTAFTVIHYERRFEHAWLRNLYWPAAKVEALIRGEDMRKYETQMCVEFGYEFSP